MLAIRINSFIKYLLSLISTETLFSHKSFCGNNFIAHFWVNIDQEQNQIQKYKYWQLYQTFLETYSIQEQSVLQEDKCQQLYYTFWESYSSRLVNHIKKCGLFSKFKYHCVNSVQIRSYFWSVFSCIRIQSPVFGHFSRSVLFQVFSVNCISFNRCILYNWLGFL